MYTSDSDNCQITRLLLVVFVNYYVRVALLRMSGFPINNVYHLCKFQFWKCSQLNIKVWQNYVADYI